MAVARAGLEELPPVRPPEALRRVLGFSRLQGPALGTVRRVLETDRDFRDRVVAATDPSEVGRAGWLWLARPDGWAEDLDGLVADAEAAERARADEHEVARLRRALTGAQDAARRHEDLARAARTGESGALADLGAERAGRRSAERLLANARAEIERVTGQLVDALRSLADRDEALAVARTDLDVARTALREAERELADRHRVGPFDPTGLGRRVADAAVAAAALAAGLADAAAELSEPVPPVEAPAVRAVRGEGPGSSPARSSAGRRRRTRRPADLPPGVRDDASEAATHLMRLPGAAVLVDGYNVARTAWPGLAPEDERTRLLAALDETHTRTGAEVFVVFDGLEAASGVAGRAGRSVRVRFTDEAVTADEALLDLIGQFSVERPVIVVSSDREVADGARARGASPVSSRQFLTALGR